MIRLVNSRNNLEETKVLLEKQLRATSINTIAENGNTVIHKGGNGNQLSDVVILEHLQKTPYLNMLWQNI